MQTHALLTNDHIRTLLALSRRDDDPRTSAALTLILWLCLTLSELKRLCWPDCDFSSRSLRVFHDGKLERVPLSDLVVAQLLAIRQVATHSRVFGPATSHPTVNDLLQRLLVRANLPGYTIDDLLRWSCSQSIAVRQSIATT